MSCSAPIETGAAGQPLEKAGGRGEIDAGHPDELQDRDAAEFSGMKTVVELKGGQDPYAPNTYRVLL